MLTSLDDLRWQNRIIIVFGEPDQTTRDLKELEEAQPEIDDRDVIWFVVSPPKVYTNFEGDLGDEFGVALQRRFLQKPISKGEIVLIGKDGGVKQRSTTLDLPDLYRLIDSMPMRRAEMREDQFGTTLESPE